MAYPVPRKSKSSRNENVMKQITVVQGSVRTSVTLAPISGTIMFFTIPANTPTGNLVLQPLSLDRVTAGTLTELFYDIRSSLAIVPDYLDDVDETPAGLRQIELTVSSRGVIYYEFPEADLDDPATAPTLMLIRDLFAEAVELMFARIDCVCKHVVHDNYTLVDA